MSLKTTTAEKACEQRADAQKSAAPETNSGPPHHSHSAHTGFSSEDRADTRRTALTLAVARLCLSLCGLALSFVESSAIATAPRVIFSAYTLYSALVLAALKWKPEQGIRFPGARWLADILCFALLAAFADGSQGVLFVLALLILCGAAYQQSLPQTLATGFLIGILFLLGNAANVLFVRGQPAASGWAYIGISLVYFAIFLIACLLVGIGAEKIFELHTERVAIAKVIGGIKSNVGSKLVLNQVFSDLRAVFKARKIVVAAHAKSSGIVHLIESGSGTTGESSLCTDELDEGLCDIYLFPEPGRTWAMECGQPADGARPGARVLDVENRRLRRHPLHLPPGLLMVHPCRSLVAHSFDAGLDWSIRVFVMDPGQILASRAGLSFVSRLLTQVWPPIFEVFLAHKSLQNAAELERASLARELHDGVIQTLVTIDMKLESLRRRHGPGSEGLSEKIEQIQKHLRDEVRDQRNIMHRLRRPSLGPSECVGELRNAAALFEEETGISTHFESTVDQVALPPRVCGEMLRILQEALVNVRKHSDAHSVEIFLRGGERAYAIEVADDGRGFDFYGRMEFEELKAQGKGPGILMERIRLVAGKLAIKSTPGQGARLEITIPRETNDSQSL